MLHDIKFNNNIILIQLLEYIFNILILNIIKLKFFKDMISRYKQMAL